MPIEDSSDPQASIVDAMNRGETLTALQYLSASLVDTQQLLHDIIIKCFNTKYERPCAINIVDALST